MTVASNKYGDYFIPEESKHRNASKLTIEGGVYEEETIEYLINNSKGNQIVHAGTYFGDFLPALSSAYKNVFAFEINKVNFDAALKTIELNKLDNVNLSFNALGDKMKIVNVQTKNNGIALGGASNISANGSNQVEQVKLDDVVGGKIDIIQLDVEGYELNVLMGATKVIKKNKPIILLEDNMNNTHLFMHKLGYTNVGKVNNNKIYEYNII